MVISLDCSPISNAEYLFSIVCKEYPIRVQMSRQTRPKYYSLRKGIGRVAKLPKRYKDKVEIDKDGYFIFEGERIVANSRSVGKPKYLPINNQYIYAGKGAHFTRTAIVNCLKEYFTPIVKEIPFVKDKILIVDCELHSEYNYYLPDMDNIGSIYWKVFSDTMVKEEVIEDDSALFISKPGCSPRFYPIANLDDRQLIFHFFEDTNRSNVKLRHNEHTTI